MAELRVKRPFIRFIDLLLRTFIISFIFLPFIDSFVLCPDQF